jgi:hypothetical protein
VRDGWIYAWSTDEQEKSTLSDTPPAAEMLPSTGDTPHVGYYVNDSTGAKMQYDLPYAVVLADTDCAAVGTQTLDDTLTITSNAPADAANLPEGDIGPDFGAPPGTMLIDLRVHAPAGSTFGTMTLGRQKLRFETLAHNDHLVARLAILLEPGETPKFKMEPPSGAGQSRPPVVDITPCVRPGPAPQVSGPAG